jgi:guanine deaminase
LWVDLDEKRIKLLPRKQKRPLIPGDRAHLEVAVDLSIKKMLGGCAGPFGAVIVRGGRVVASGYNQVTSRNDPTCHAEIVAIRAACKKLKAFHLTGCRLYTSCEPCPMCLGAVYWARLEGVYYALSRRDAAKIGFADEFIYKEIAKPADQRSIPMIRMPDARATEAFRRWVSNPNRVPY